MEFSYEVEGFVRGGQSGRAAKHGVRAKLREFVTDVIAGGSSRIVVNLENTAFMDSSGLGALIGCLKAARQSGDLDRGRAAAGEDGAGADQHGPGAHLYASAEEAFSND